MSFLHQPFPFIAESELADRDYNIRAPIDGIIGVNILAIHMRDGIRRNPYGLMAQATSFGWIISGGVNGDEVDTLGAVKLVSSHDVYNQVRKMWELDELHDKKKMPQKDQDCETLYKSTIVKAKKGTVSPCC